MYTDASVMIHDVSVIPEVCVLVSVRSYWDMGSHLIFHRLLFISVLVFTKVVDDQNI